MAISRRISLSLYGPLAERIQRLAASVPHSTINRIGASCVQAGIDEVERELRKAAARIVAEHDAERL